MIDPRYSRPAHLLVAIPISAYTAALAMLYSGGPREPVSVDLVLFAMQIAVLLTFNVLPFWLVGGVLAYFTLRSFRWLGAIPYALVGLAIGLTAAGVLVKEFSEWAVPYAVVGVVSALAGYGALWLLARPPALTPEAEAAGTTEDMRPTRATSGWARPAIPVAAAVSAALGVFIAYHALTSLIPPHEKLVVARGADIVGPRGLDFLLDNGEIWLYPLALPGHSKPPFPQESDFRQLELRASPQFGRHALYNYKMARSVREIYEVRVGSRAIIRYEDVAAAKRDAGYPASLYVGIGLIGLGSFFAVRYAYASRAA
jgi:hypothetical protein